MPSSKPKILLVDDDPIVLRLLEATLRGGPFKLFQAKTAIEGLRLAREEKPHLMFLDVMLGSDNGLRLCKKLKEDPETQAIRIVIVSAHDDPTTRLRARQAGASGFFAKPFSPLALWRTVDELIAS